MNEQIISVAEAKKHFSEILGEVAYSKKLILITRRGQPMARIIPVDETSQHLGDIKGWLDENDLFLELLIPLFLKTKSISHKF